MGRDSTPRLWVGQISKQIIRVECEMIGLFRLLRESGKRSK